MNFRSISNQYHKAANKIAARGDKTGTLNQNQHRAIAYYRDTAVKVEALIHPDDSKESVWYLEGRAELEFKQTKKVTAASKMATPQELLAKAK
jgi:hypothetical protein